MRKRGVLIVDDEPDISTVISSWLNDDGVQCHCVTSTADGLREISSHVPACVIVDLRLAQPSTIEFAKAVRTNPNTTKVPILIVTGATDTDSAQAREEIAAVGDATVPVANLNKPFTMMELQNKLVRLVGTDDWVRKRTAPTA